MRSWANSLFSTLVSPCCKIYMVCRHRWFEDRCTTFVAFNVAYLCNDSACNEQLLCLSGIRERGTTSCVRQSDTVKGREKILSDGKCRNLFLSVIFKARQNWSPKPAGLLELTPNPHARAPQNLSNYSDSCHTVRIVDQRRIGKFGWIQRSRFIPPRLHPSWRPCRSRCCRHFF